AEYLVALLPVGVLAEPPVVQPTVVLDHSGGVEGADLARQLARERGWRADGEHRYVGVKVQGRGVELEDRGQPHQMETYHSADRLQEARLEFHAEPVTPLALTDLERLRLTVRTHGDLPCPRLRMAGQGEVKICPVGGVTRSDEVGGHRTSRVCLYRHDVLVLMRSDTLRRCVVGGGAEAAAEVGHAHAREHVSAHGIRRKRAGAAENTGGDTRRRQQLPEGRPPA